MLQTEETSLTERQQYWLKHLRACESAGQTTIAYARENDINVKTLYSARKALAEKGTLPRPQALRFQKVKTAADQPCTNGQWRIQLPNGVMVAFGGEFDASTLSRVLGAAASLS